MGFQADCRAASVTLLSDYGTSAGLKLQVYPARPRSIFPPSAFVDGISETIDYTGPVFRQRNATVEMVVVHGIFDSAEAAAQKDVFADGFIDWVRSRYHAAGTNSIVAVTQTADLPNYVPEWMPPERQLVYYATRIVLEGLSG